VSALVPARRDRGAGTDPTPIAPTSVGAMKLSVVILNWNALEDTAACVRAVQGWEATGVVERPTIWVVDNGSRPPGVEPLREACPDVNVIRSPTNRGFAGGNNLGIGAALAGGADAVLLLNNDASLDAGSVAAMLETLESDGSVGCVGPTIWHGGQCVSSGGRDIARHGITHIRPSEPPTSLQVVDYVPGTAALIRREVFERVGLLDEDYFFGGEMADLCHRARLRGFRSVTDPRARALHDLDRSSEDRQTLHIYYILRNRFLFVRKHYPRRRAWLYACWLARAGLTAGRALCRGDWRRARAAALGGVDGIRGRFAGQNRRVLS
jgi:GT2 family glycosyltransferase